MQDPVLILGASGTIGTAIARHLHGAGRHVLAHGSRPSDGLAALAGDLGTTPSVFDVTDEDAVAAALREIETRR